MPPLPSLRPVALLALAALAACSPGAPVPSAVAAPTPGEAGCLRDVAATTGNPEVTILDALPSEAGTEVTVGVGPDRAPWRCIGYADGTTGEIMSLTDEGAL